MKGFVSTLSAVLTGFAIAGFVMLLPSFGQAGSGTPAVTLEIPDLILDPAHPYVANASFDSLLVNWGTEQPYNGQGPPGLILRVETPGTVLDWHMVGWANHTTPPSIKICAQDSVYFSNYDWAFQADGSGAGGNGLFRSVPSTVPQRIGPGGDQCFLRVDATGTWTAEICIEGPPNGPEDRPGAPRGRYRDSEGLEHLDLFDTCIERTYRV